MSRSRIERFPAGKGGKALLAAGAVIALAFYYRVDPSRSVWAPKCIFHWLTGLDCPACGGQRALHAALHGEWTAALHHNPFLLISLPYLAAVAYTTYSTDRYARHAKPWVRHPKTVKTYVVLFFLWWIVRNTPLWS